jgi:hypothetical protein
MFEHLGADVSYATRLLARSRAFTVACVVALGLAIGVNLTTRTSTQHSAPTLSTEH